MVSMRKNYFNKVVVNKINTSWITFLSVLLLSYSSFAQTAYTSGNLVVLRDDSTSGLGTPISLVEYTTAGVQVSIDTLPFTGSSRIVNSGSATSEGSLSLDAERTHLILAGYDTTIRVTGVASAANINRVLYSVGPSAMPVRVIDLPQSIVYTANNIRGGTANGNNYYGSGAGSLAGIQLMGASSSVQITSSPTNTRVVQIFNGQMYVSTGSGTTGVYSVGTGIPAVTGATSVLAGATVSPYGFSISPDSNTLYIADDNTGIRKYTRTGGAGPFTFAYTVTTTTCRGITVDYTASPYVIYATTAVASANTLIKISDAGASSAIATLATAPVNTVFRGVSFAPACFANISGTATICSGSTAYVTFTGNPNDTITYKVNGGTPQTVILGSNGRAYVSTGTLTNSGPGSATYTYALVSISTSICSNSPVTGNAVITVNPLPVVGAITGPPNVCSGSTITLSDTTVGGTWSSLTTGTASVGSTGVVTGGAAGMAIISYAVTGGCGVIAMYDTITVNALPTTTISGTAAIPSGGTTNIIFNGTPGATVYYTANGSGPFSVVLNASGTDTLSVTLSTSTTYALVSAMSSVGCSATVSGSVTVTVGAAATASVSGTTAICPGGSATLAFSGTPSATVVYTINAGTPLSLMLDASGNYSMVVFPSVTSVYSISYVASSGDTETISSSVTVTINTRPTASIVSVSADTICNGAGASVTFAGTPDAVVTYTTDGGTTTATFTLSSGGGYVLPVSPTVTTTYQLLSVTNPVTSCDSSLSGNAVIAVRPLPTAIITGTTIIPIGDSTVLTFTGTPGGVVGYTANGSGPLTITLDGLGNYSLTVTPTITTVYALTDVNIAGCDQAVTGSATITIVTPFTSGNLVICKTNGNTSAGTSISLVECSTSGVIAGTTTLPSSGAGRIVSSGSASSEGQMTLDAERTHIIVTGYDTSAGVGGVASAAGINRVLCSVPPSSIFSIVSNVPQSAAYTVNNIRSATANGTNYYTSGTASTGGPGGIRLATASASSAICTTPANNTRVVQIYNGGLYFSTSSGTQGIYEAGTGIPSTSVTGTLVSAVGAGIGTSPYSFTISPDGNTLYVADDVAGIQKFTRTGGSGTFTFSYIVNATAARGLTADFTTTPYTIYATTAPTAPPNALIQVIDGGSGSSATTLLSSTATSNFRGVCFTPSSYAHISLLTPATICNGDSSKILFSGNPGDSVTYTLNGVGQTIVIGNTGYDTLIAPLTSVDTPSAYVYALVSINTSVNHAASAIGSVTVNVNPSPTVVLGADPNICIGATSALLTYTAAAVSPTTYAVTWDPTAVTAGFTNIIGASVTSSPLAVPVYTGASAGATYSGVIKIQNITGCSSNYPFNIHVSTVNPTGDIASADVPCIGSSTNVIFNGTAGDSIVYSMNGATQPTVVLDGTGSYTVATGSITMPVAYELLTTANSTCTLVIDTNITITPVAGGTWLGTTSSDWSIGTNWACGSAPSAAVSVNIPSGTPHDPEILSGSFEVNGLNIAPGGVLTIDAGSTLNVDSALVSNGNIVGAGKIILSGTTPQAIIGSMAISNLELDNTTSATITGALHLSGGLTFTPGSGTFNTGDSLVLLSNATSTANIGALAATSSVNGNVTCQQYLPGGKRAFRFLGHPFSSAITLQQLEDNIDVTGSGGALNGFTSTYTNNPSSFWYDTYTGSGSTIKDSTGWKSYTNITDSWNRYQGIYVLVRGQKYEGLWVCDTCYTPSPVTISLTGHINQQVQSITLAMGDTSNYNVISNPYPSPVDIGTVVYNAQQSGNVSGSAFWVWDPYIAVRGAYVTMPIGIGAPSIYNLESLASFEVSAMYDGAQLVFNEINKATTATDALLRTTASPEPFVMLHLYDTNGKDWDRTYLYFNDAASEIKEAHDNGKIHNPDLDFYTLTPGRDKLNFDARPFVNDKVIPLGITTDKPQTFTIKVDKFTVPDGGQLFLHDKYTGTYQELLMGSNYTFTISADTLSQGDNRLELAMVQTPNTTSVTTTTVESMNVSLIPNPATSELTINYTFSSADAKSLNIVDVAGISLIHADLGTAQQGSKKLSLNTLSAGMYLVQVSCGNKVLTRRLIKE